MAICLLGGPIGPQYLRRNVRCPASLPPQQVYYTAAEAAAILRVNHDISDPERDDFRVTTMAEGMEMSYARLEELLSA